MKRSPIVISATVAGLAGVLAFHTTPAKLSLGTLPTADGGQPTPSSDPATPAAARATGAHRAAARHAAKRASGTSSSSTSSSGTRSGTGGSVNYGYGVMSVKVTVSGTKILDVGIASIDDGGNPHSESIDQQAIPILEQEAMQAQSADIQGVSGASYTSTGFTQSLQSALHGLNFR
ncbi:MAG TPA: FMN-binding protein [Trebonia sp.]|jgi:uncharacterized protein with FMN-binding domain|nr:FMN-binding protein [Trebonia sp.]